MMGNAKRSTVIHRGCRVERPSLPSAIAVHSSITMCGVASYCKMMCVCDVRCSLLVRYKL
jgi:hypothetical protein